MNTVKPTIKAKPHDLSQTYKKSLTNPTFSKLMTNDIRQDISRLSKDNQNSNFFSATLMDTYA